MPTRMRRFVILIAAALAAWAVGPIFAQEAPNSSYRLRPARGRGQQLQVEEDAEPAPARISVPGRISASLSDDEPAAEEESGDRSQESGDRSQEAGDRGQESGDRGTEGQRDGGNYSPSLRHSVAPPPPHSVSPSLPHSRSLPLPLSPSPTLADGKPPLKLSPRSETGGRQLAKPNPTAGLGSLGSLGGALAVVLALFVVVVWLTRRVGPSGSAPLPKEAVELLGRTPVGGQHALQLVRVGNRLLLIALSPQGAATLTEIIDPHEVERLTALCQGQRPGSASHTFAQTVAQLEREPTGRSFVDQRRPAAGSMSNRPRSSRAA